MGVPKGENEQGDNNCGKEKKVFHIADGTAVPHIERECGGNENEDGKHGFGSFFAVGNGNSAVMVNSIGSGSCEVFEYVGDEKQEK